MKRERLILPQSYVHALGKALKFDISTSEALRTKEARKRLEEYADAVRQISEGLTKQRSEFLASHYLADAKMREAYLLYYTTTNILKVIAPLREYFLFHSPENISVLDLGCGTGAASWGCADVILEGADHGGALSFTFVDTVKENLDICKTFASVYLPPEAQTTYHRIDLGGERSLRPLAEKKYSIIMMMNTLNELPAGREVKLLEEMLSLLDDNGIILIIEPAAKDASRRLLVLRDAVRGAVVYAPCTRVDACPALAKENDWCHSEVAWERPEFIRLIDEMTGTLRLSLKYSYLSITKGKSLSDHLGGRLSRIVSEVFVEKGRRRAFLCNDEGRREHVMNLRDKNTANSSFLTGERYDVLRLTSEEVREHDVRISGASVVEHMLLNSGAR